jgi:lipopolysaccharide transport system ATP-binding protein
MHSKNIAIKVDNITKRYRIGTKEEMQDSFGGAIFEFIKSPIKNYRKYRSLYKFDDSNPESNPNSADVIWALKGVSFEVKQGEVVGIIGRNGAGKSTLLKILSKITPPTTGFAKIFGRVSSLLEVGTGFHQELTGRENIYLNGTILGMTKKEVDLKFDKIVSFSGIERFIDTPVKRYSSGMRVRLAFSVAAHLEPDIMIIDEVLAVGDMEFQKKCLGKMDQIARKGRALIFVSHNLSAINQICDRAILLEDGRIQLTGSTSKVINSYVMSGAETNSTWTNTSDQASEEDVQIKAARILSEDSLPTAIVDFDQEFKVEISYEVTIPTKFLIIMLRLSDSLGNVIWTSWDVDTNDWKDRVRQLGKYVSICKISGSLLKPDRYLLSVAAFVNGVKLLSHHENILAFDVSVNGYNFNIGRIGIITPVLEWTVNRIDEAF